MADISSYLKKILEAIYGEEVRGSIHDALAAMNVESSSAMQFASTAKDSAQASAVNAQSSANIAAQKADDATVSAGAAKLSETNAKGSETIAIQKAADAIAAATAAKASETSAEHSANTATQKAGEAEDSKAASALSEAEAKAAEDRVRAVKTDVEALGDQVAADKVAADASRTAAEAARDAADISEANALASANAALAAKAASEIAQSDAEAAALAVQTDKTAAERAKDDAETAKTSAENARDNASKSADDAASSALSAQQYSGKPPMPQNGTWWIWDAEQQKYIDTSIGCELVGPIGVGIEDIQLTSGDHTPGTTDVYTVKLTDGSSHNISVYNGRDGEGVGNVVGISFDLLIPLAGWLDGEITVADERIVANRRYKYLISAYSTDMTEYVECNVQPQDVETTGFMTFKNDADPQTDITVNVIRLELAVNGEEEAT